MIVVSHWWQEAWPNMASLPAVVGHRLPHPRPEGGKSITDVAKDLPRWGGGHGHAGHAVEAITRTDHLGRQHCKKYGFDGRGIEGHTGVLAHQVRNAGPQPLEALAQQRLGRVQQTRHRVRAEALGERQWREGGGVCEGRGQIGQPRGRRWHAIADARDGLVDQALELRVRHAVRRQSRGPDGGIGERRLVAPRLVAAFRWRCGGCADGWRCGAQRGEAFLQGQRAVPVGLREGAGSRASGVASRPSRSLGACHAGMRSLEVIGVPPCAFDQGTTPSAPAHVRGPPRRPSPSPPAQGAGGGGALRSHSRQR